MKKENAQSEYTNFAFVKIAVALVVLIMSSLSISSTGYIGEMTSIFNIKLPLLPMTSLYKMPETFVYLVFAFFHALIASDRQNANKNINCKTLYFFGDWLLFTSFYKLILLPACGFGFFEWIMLGIVFFFEFLVTAQGKFSSKIISQSIDPLIVVGVFMLLFKLIVRYMLKTNLSVDILENNTAMNLISFLIFAVAIYGIKSAISSLKLTKDIEIPESVKKTSAKVFSAIFKVFQKLISFIIKTILKLVSNPFVLLIIAGATLLLGVAGVLIGLWKINSTIKAISTDIKQFIAPILRFALETDNPAYADDNLNTIGMIASFMIFIAVKYWENNNTVKIEQRILQIEADEKERQKQIESRKEMEFNFFDELNKKQKKEQNNDN